MPDFMFRTRGLTAQDREQWEKDNIEQLNKMGYNSFDEETKQLAFKKAAFKNKFGNRPDYNDLKLMPQEKKDSLYLASPDDDIENLQVYQNTKQDYVNNLNEHTLMSGKLYGSAETEWNSLDKMLDEISPYYKRYKGSEYFPLDDKKKIDLLSTFKTEAEAFGQDVAAKKMANRIQDEVSENQPLTDKIWNGLAGMGANIVGGTISFAGNIVGGLNALTGLDRLLGENQKEGYLDNLWSQFLDNSWTRYGDQVMKQGTLFTEDDPEKAYNRHEIIRTTEEQENLWDNIFSVNTIPELMQQSGFTVASMIEGYGLTAVGNRLFNTLKYATMAKKLEATAETAANVNKALQNINTWQRRYNAYAIPALVGQGEGALNALNTKQDYLEDAKQMIQKEQSERMEAEVQKRMNEWWNKTPLTKTSRDKGTYSRDYQAAEKRIREEVWKEYQPMYEDAVRRAEEDADKAALTNFTLNSLINGAANVTLKATMFNGKTREALSRSKIGKLFTGNKYSIDDAGNVVAKELTKKQMAWNMSKEMLGEGLEEYGQDVSDAFSRGAAENDLSNYIEQRYRGITDDAISDSMVENLGAAFAAAGKKAISKDAIQSGIYGALGQVMGTPNVNALLSKSDRVSLKDKSTLGKVGAIARNLWRSPLIESYYHNKQENQDRRESAKVLNDWLNLGNNRERLMTLKGSLGWAKSMQDAADEGDEFSYRNSRLGKTINDYFMLQQLKGTPVYDAYMQRYMDILNAKEGDAMAQQMAQYDDRPLKDVQADAQAMLDVMQNVQKATTDIERNLGNSIPQEVKESLIYGKLSMDDWTKRAKDLEEEITKISSGRVATSLTGTQKSYIARHGSIEAPKTYDKTIEELETKINNLENNKGILSDKQKQDLKGFKKVLNNLKKEQSKELKGYQELSEGIEGTPVLSAADIMGLNPTDRFIMLNPKNRKNYSEEQQRVIENVVEKGTAASSDFMNKIEDAARIDNTQKVFLKQYNEALKNPKILENINNRLKLNARYEDAVKSYQKIAKIQDYAEFAKAVDDVIQEGDPFSLSVMGQVLKDNPNYERYKKDNEVIEGIYNQLLNDENLKGISGKDKDLVLAMTQFLSRKGVDVSDYDNAIATLTAADNTGKSNLTSYIEEMNRHLPKDGKISLDNISTIVTNYQKALKGFKKNEETKKQVTREPEDKPSTSANPAPTTNIFSSPSASATKEEADAKLKAQQEAEQQGTPEGTPTTTPETTNDEIISIPDNFINNNDNDEVLNAVQSSVNSINSANESIYGGDAKELANTAIEELSNKKYSTPEEYRSALTKKAEELKNKATQGGDVNERASSVLNKAANSIKAGNSTSGGTQNTSGNQATQDTSDKTGQSGQESTTISLASVDTNKKGFLSDKFKIWKVDEYLRSGKLIRGGKNKSLVYFVTLNDVTEGVKADMGNNYSEDNHLPVIAVVEDENGPIVIGKKKYQPIGILPRSEKDTRAAKIRDLAKGNPGSLVASGNSILSTTVKVVSPRIEVSTESKTDRSIFSLLIDDISRNNDDKADYDNRDQDMSKAKKVWKKYVDKFISRLKVVKKDKGNIELVYQLPTMKGDGSISEMPVLTKTLSETTSPTTGKFLSEVLQNGSPSEITAFNSRTNSFIGVLKTLLERYDLSGLTSNGKEFTGDTSDKGVLTALTTAAGSLQRHIYSTSEKYSIRPAIVSTPSGNQLGLDLYLGDERLGRIVNSTSDKSITAENAAEILRNLFNYNPSTNTFRENLNWQVDKDPDFEKQKILFNSKMNSAVADNILKLGIPSLERNISSVELDVPNAIKDVAPANKVTTTNSDNATSTDSKPIDTATNQQGKEVNVDTGLDNKGKSDKNTVTPAMQEAENISNQIKEDSQDIELDGNEKGYHSKSTGKLYARVTSVIQAVEDASERFDPNSPWVLSSTNIGNTIDELVRDFFAGKITIGELGKTTYSIPNMSSTQAEKFINQLVNLQAQLSSQGLTIIPRDVVATGTLAVTDNNGNTSEIPVAGTLDLLAYDSEGNFHIFDMKTHHGDITEEKKAKWSRQLSLYKQFLEGKYDIKIKSINIIPIKVEYPEPNRHNKYEQSTGNQIKHNGKDFKNANPNLEKTIPLKETNVSVLFDKLTDEEKALIAPTTQPQQPTADNKAELNKNEPKEIKDRVAISSSAEQENNPNYYPKNTSGEVPVFGRDVRKDNITAGSKVLLPVDGRPKVADAGGDKVVMFKSKSGTTNFAVGPKGKYSGRRGGAISIAIWRDPTNSEKAAIEKLLEDTFIKWTEPFTTWEDFASKIDVILHNNPKSNPQSTQPEVSEVESKPEPKADTGGLKMGTIHKKRKAIPKKDSKPVSRVSDPIGTTWNDLSPEIQEAFRSKYKDIIDIEDYFNNTLTKEMRQNEIKCFT